VTPPDAGAAPSVPSSMPTAAAVAAAAVTAKITAIEVVSIMAEAYEKRIQSQQIQLSYFGTPMLLVVVLYCLVGHVV